MQGNFVYSNPTKLYFGENAITGLENELGRYGKNVLLCYGGGSIKKNGVYNDVISALRNAGKMVFEDSGVMPNPTIDKVLQGAALAREHEIDLILAVGGGSVIDYAKAVSASAYCKEDPWIKFYVNAEMPSTKLIPIGCVLTMAGTGSEMNGTSVISNNAVGKKYGCAFGEILMPKFSILNPEYTLSLPKYQMIAGIFDIMSHIMEQYFSGNDDNVSDYIAEGLMRSVINSGRAAAKNPLDYEARSNIMWAATWALNSLLGKGKTGDWEVHAIGHAITAATDSTHGMTLASFSIPYYRYIMDAGLHKFKRFAINVWSVAPRDMDDTAIAKAGLDAMEEWMREIGAVMNPRELGVTDEMIDGIAESAFKRPGAYKVMTNESIAEILRTAMGEI